MVGCLRWEVMGSLLLHGRLKFSSTKSIIIENEQCMWRECLEKVFMYRCIFCNQISKQLYGPSLEHRSIFLISFILMKFYSFYNLKEKRLGFKNKKGRVEMTISFMWSISIPVYTQLLSLCHGCL